MTYACFNNPRTALHHLVDKNGNFVRAWPSSRGHRPWRSAWRLLHCARNDCQDQACLADNFELDRMSVHLHTGPDSVLICPDFTQYLQRHGTCVRDGYQRIRPCQQLTQLTVSRCVGYQKVDIYRLPVFAITQGNACASAKPARMCTQHISIKRGQHMRDALMVWTIKHLLYPRRQTLPAGPATNRALAAAWLVHPDAARCARKY